MPERDKAVERALRVILKGTKMRFSRTSAFDTAQIGDEVMTMDDYYRRFWDPIDRVYERVVDSIDWHRVLLEASSRCYYLREQAEKHGGEAHPPEFHGYRWLSDEGTCPACVNEALLAGTTFTDWKRQPTLPRRWPIGSKSETPAFDRWGNPYDDPDADLYD